MKIEIDVGILILVLFLYILIAIVLLELVYFENTLKELVLLMNNIRGT